MTAGFFSASTLWPNLHVTPEMRERSWEALERMEATRLANQLVGEMSAGEKRRIVIARALVHRPKQLLLDEPSNALDLAAQRELRQTMQRLAQEGTGLVLVSMSRSRLVMFSHNSAFTSRSVASGNTAPLGWICSSGATRSQ